MFLTVLVLIAIDMLPVHNLCNSQKHIIIARAHAISELNLILV